MYFHELRGLQTTAPHGLGQDYVSIAILRSRGFEVPRMLLLPLEAAHREDPAKVPVPRKTAPLRCPLQLQGSDIFVSSRLLSTRLQSQLQYAKRAPQQLHLTDRSRGSSRNAQAPYERSEERRV